MLNKATYFVSPNFIKAQYLFLHRNLILPFHTCQYQTMSCYRIKKLYHRAQKIQRDLVSSLRTGDVLQRSGRITMFYTPDAVCSKLQHTIPLLWYRDQWCQSFGRKLSVAHDPLSNSRWRMLLIVPFKKKKIGIQLLLSNA